MEMLTHGDDFVPENFEEDLDWIVMEFLKELKTEELWTLDPTTKSW